MISKHNSIKNFSKKELLGFYREMLLIRRFEEKAGQLYGMGLIAGFCHLYIGQEAIASGMSHTMKDGDKVITTYRDHGHMISVGSDPKKIMAELLGRRDGSSKGKGGSMHLFDFEKHFYGGHGIVGASVPIGAGLAFADKYLDKKNYQKLIKTDIFFKNLRILLHVIAKQNEDRLLFDYQNELALLLKYKKTTHSKRSELFMKDVYEAINFTTFINEVLLKKLNPTESDKITKITDSHFLIIKNNYLEINPKFQDKNITPYIFDIFMFST
jgi:hypothetical protein